MEMILSPRPVKFSSGRPQEGLETGIECKILGRRHQKLLVGVLVPTESQPTNSSRSPSFIAPPADRDSLDSVVSSSTTCSFMEKNDDGFRRKLHEKDAAFLKHIHARDSMFRAKFASESRSMEWGAFVGA